VIVPEKKDPEQIERDMVQTRESITEKVAALETQVKGNIEAVTGTVEAVKDAISAAPAAVSNTVKQTVAAVKDSVRETVGTSTAVGFLAGFFLLGGRFREGAATGTAAFVPQSAAAPIRGPGFFERIFGDAFEGVGKQLRDVADKAVSTGVAALKQNVSTVVPQLVDQAVHRVTDPVTSSMNGSTSTPRMMDGSGV